MLIRPAVTLHSLGGLGSAISFVCGIFALFGATTSSEGVVAICALLVAVFFLAAAITTQTLRRRRPLRYARVVPRLLRVAEKTHVRDPATLTSEQAIDVCKNLLNDIASIYSEVSDARCLATIEVMTSDDGVVSPQRRRARDYQVKTLCRDEACEDLEHGIKIRQSIEGSTIYDKIFNDPTCGAHYFSRDVASEREFRCAMRKLHTVRQIGAATSESRAAWAPYRSTIVVKICEAERCSARSDHFPIGYLWLRSPAVNAFDAEIDVEVLQSLSRSLASIVTRVTRATLPSHDFRREAPDLSQAHARAPGV